MASNSCSSDNLSSVSDSLVEAIKNPDHVQFQEIREKYFDILERLKQSSDGAGDGGCTTDELNVQIVQVNKVFEKVKRTDEARLDAKVLKQVGILGKANIEKTQSSLLTFKPSEYADNLVNFMNNGESVTEIFEAESVSLRRLSESMSYLYRSTYGFEPLYGALDWKPPERPAPRAQIDRGEMRRPVVKNAIERVENPTTNEENQMEEVTRVLNFLRRRFQENDCEPIPLLEFVIDPTCFATTVQNIFHTSFLIRDNLAELSFGDDKIPCLTPTRKRGVEARRNSGTEQNKQSVIEMNMSLWEEAIRVIGITEAMIPSIKRNSKRQL